MLPFCKRAFKVQQDRVCSHQMIFLDQTEGIDSCLSEKIVERLNRYKINEF